MKRTLTILAIVLASRITLADPPDHAQASEFQSVAGKQAAEVLAAYEKHGMFDGAVLLATKGKIVFKGAYGQANRDWGIPNSTNTKFSIASLGKAMTAHLVLQLVDEALVVLDRPIATYLPDLNKRIADKVTVHHLLAHSSGLSWWASNESGYETKSYTLNELVNRAQGLDLQFEPGSRTLYSNSGYNLLAAIIERVTGGSFEDAMRERILKPAGMSDTGFSWIDAVVARSATGYDRLPGGEYVPAAPNDQSYAIGAGGLYSTVEDLFRWNLYLDRKLSPESRKLMFKDHIGGNGYGWGISRYGGKDGAGGKYALGLGGTYGFASVQSRCLDDDHYIVILSNVRQLDQSSITNDMVNIIVGFDASPPTRSKADAFFRELLEGDRAGMLERYKKLIGKDSDFPGEGSINTAGYAFLEHQRLDQAIALLRFNVAAYPKSWNAFDSLSEAYEIAGSKKLAIESAQASLKLNPNNEAATRRIERLQP